MTVKEFVEGYDNIASDKLKMAYINDNLEVKQYMSIADKIVFAEKIVNTCSYKLDVNGDKSDIISFDSIAREILFIMGFIDLYTNINIDFRNCYGEYDLLKITGLLDMLINFNDSDLSFLSISEYKEIASLIDLKINDLIRNELSAQAVFNKEMNNIIEYCNDKMFPILKSFDLLLSNIDKSSVEKIVKHIDKITKKRQ